MDNKPAKTMLCTCCGDYTKGRQWFNQDKGYTVCPKCAVSMKTYKPFGRDSIESNPEYFKQTYGVAGIHYDVGV